MRIKLMMVPALLLSLAASAGATQRVVTPRIFPDEAGSLACGIVNTSSTKTVHVEVALFDFAGTPIFTSGPLTLNPNGSGEVSSHDIRVRHCVVTVLDGRKTDVRVSLTAANAQDQPTAVVAGE